MTANGTATLWDEPEEPSLDTDEAWRGDVHLADWPEELAGPEYRMFKLLVAGGDGSAR